MYVITGSLPSRANVSAKLLKVDRNMRKHHVEEKLNVLADILQISGIQHQVLDNHFASLYPELS
jgi:hypothetical protein